MNKIFLIPPMIFILLVSGCISVQNGADKTVSAKDTATTKCIELCSQEKAKNVLLSDGPCLSDKITEGWVCDVAHSPRQAIDNDPANQCPEFGKTAGHFVEVDEDCKFIRAV